MPSLLKILLVDDNPTILKLLCRSVEKCGEIITATDGADALVKSIENRPDLIISDYSMPVMDGRGLLEKLRAQRETALLSFWLRKRRSTSGFGWWSTAWRTTW